MRAIREFSFDGLLYTTDFQIYPINDLLGDFVDEIF